MDSQLESGTPITTTDVVETTTPEVPPQIDGTTSTDNINTNNNPTSTSVTQEEKEAPSAPRSSFIRRRLRRWRRNKQDGGAEDDDTTPNADSASSEVITEEDRKRELTKLKWKRDRLNTELNMLAQWSQDKQRQVRRLERQLRRNVLDFALEQGELAAEEEEGEEDEDEDALEDEEMYDGFLSPEGTRSPAGSISPRQTMSPRKTRSRKNSEAADPSKIVRSSSTSVTVPEAQEATERVVTFGDVIVAVTPPEDNAAPAADDSSGTQAPVAAAEANSQDDSSSEETNGTQASSRRVSMDGRSENLVDKDIESGTDSSSSDDDDSSNESSDEEMHPTTYKDVVVLSNSSGGSVQIKAGNLGVIISGYSDIFSSFDPRPYSERNLSSDFLEEVNRYATFRAFKQQAGAKNRSRLLKILVPANSRNALIEDEVSDRIRNYFSSVARRHVFKLVRKFIVSSIMLIVGLVLLVLNGWLYDEYPDDGFFMSMLITTSGPAAWFFAWSGADALLWGTIKNVKGWRFWRKVSKLEVQFWGYLDVDETIAKSAAASGPPSTVTSTPPSPLQDREDNPISA